MKMNVREIGCEEMAQDRVPNLTRSWTFGFCYHSVRITGSQEIKRVEILMYWYRLRIETIRTVKGDVNENLQPSNSGNFTVQTERFSCMKEAWICIIILY